MHAFDTALYGKLHGDATLLGLAPGDVHRHVAKQGTALPFVLFAKQSEQCEYTQGASRKRTRAMTYLVKAVDDPASNNGGAIDARIDALLTDGTLTISGATLLYMRRTSGMDYVEVADGVIYRHVGGLYEIEVAE